MYRIKMKDSFTGKPYVGVGDNKSTLLKGAEEQGMIVVSLIKTSGPLWFRP